MDGTFISMKDVLVWFLDRDVGWFLISFAAILSIYGIFHQIITQEQ